jgi:hypothetical protein
MFRFISIIFFTLSSISSVFSLDINNKPIIRGVTAPFKNLYLFDQSIFAKDIQTVFLREAELKHGRLAMISTILLPLIEQFSDKPGINFFQDFLLF